MPREPLYRDLHIAGMARSYAWLKAILQYPNLVTL
jgi:hypothetical protein